MTADTFPWQAALPAIYLSLTAVTGLVISDLRYWRVGRYLFKPTAACAFLWLALAVGATGSSYGQWLLAGLLLCMVGDILLMFESERSFLAGLVAFLCGHLLYGVAFLQVQSGASGLWWSLLPVLLLAVGTLRWLLPHLTGAMRGAVIAYVVVICGMLLCAGTTWAGAGAGLVLCGAWGFAISDLSVARRQFIAPGPINQLWGTPLYFSSQMLLAASAALY